jgi:ADP-heptose:LPS heptosyltransferase
MNEPLARVLPFIDDVIVDDSTSAYGLYKKLSSYHFDISITLFSNTKVAIAQWLARIPKRVAPATKIAQIFYTHRIKQKRSQVLMAEFEYNIALAKSIFPDLNPEFKQPLLRFDKKEVEKTYQKFSKEYGVKRPVVAFHPGFGGSSDANWTLDEYIELIDSIAHIKKFQIVMTFGPDEQNLKKEAQIKAKERDIIFYISKDGLVEFAKLLASFKLFVSTSTGTYHLAALVATKTVTFFADSLFASVKRWRAVSDKSLQKPYMLSSNPEKRAEQFETVKRELSLYLESKQL